MTPSQILARNMRLIRRVLDLSQGDLAERMADFGWIRQTVTDIERLKRRLYVDELVGLAMVLQTSINTLLTLNLSLEVARTLNTESPESVNEAGGAR